MSGRGNSQGEVGEAFGFGVMYAGLGLLLVSGGILLWQAVWWLQSGVWPLLPLGWAWTLLFDAVPPSVTWVGAEEIVLWLFGCPTSGILFFAGIAAVLGGAGIITAR
jgi:hypothetical protein